MARSPFTALLAMLALLAIAASNSINSVTVDASGDLSAAAPSAAPLRVSSSLFQAAMANITRLELQLKGETSPKRITARIAVLDQLAQAYTTIKRYDASVPLRKEALELRLSQKRSKNSKKGKNKSKQADDGGTGLGFDMQLQMAFVALAQDMRDGGSYAAAVSIVHDALADLGESPAASSPAPSAGDKSKEEIERDAWLRKQHATLRTILLRLEASLLECDGDAVGAIGKFNRATKLAASNGVKLGLDEAMQHIRLLKRVTGPGSEYRDKVPPQMLAGMEGELKRQVDSMIATGRWTTPDQLPKSMVPGLASRPWHSVEDHYPHLAPVRDLLQGAHAGLMDDLSKLESEGLLERETECIHDAKGGGWSFYMVNGHWVPKDADGCSTDTPHACKLLKDIAALKIGNLKVLRGGFSVIDRAAHLQPHFGLTNAQLKFHLGLVVPRNPDTGDLCARIRVGNETRYWEAGKVLFFDDSWEHEVWNACDSKRAVFQLVFTHPDLDLASSSNPFQRALADGH